MRTDRETTVTCFTCGLRRHCLPRHLSERAAEALDGAIRRHRHARGEQLYHAGQKFRRLYVLRSGSVRIMATASLTGGHVLGFNLPGDMIGFDGAVGGKYTCSAEALEDSTSCTLTIADLSGLIEDEPRFSSRVLGMIAAELARAQAHALLLAEASPLARVAAFLDDLARRYGAIQRSRDQLLLTMSRRDIASFTGLAIETVSRSLTRLHNDGVLKVSARHIQILDHPRLGRNRAHLEPFG